MLTKKQEEEEAAFWRKWERERDEAVAEIARRLINEELSCDGCGARATVARYAGGARPLCNHCAGLVGEINRRFAEMGPEETARCLGLSTEEPS